MNPTVRLARGGVARPRPGMPADRASRPAVPEGGSGESHGEDRAADGHSSRFAVSGEKAGRQTATYSAPSGPEL
ncbi:hypothetical protein GCM10010517_48230 [Streptosporangium fragile]|uniref:Uncharacterized protein n=1 Tax=Streptosporangium fragile TaxID=46186 RepID=A0ABN3W3E4_9ACTN